MIVWTAFDAVKNVLCSTPVLSAPNFEKPFKLEVDASGTGIGAVLLQEDDDGINHPVCFYSKKFNRHQLNYSTIEKEALALRLPLQHLCILDPAQPLSYQVYSDHNPLTISEHRADKENSAGTRSVPLSGEC